MPALGVPAAAQALAPLMPSAGPPGASCQSPLGGMSGSPAAHLAALKAFHEVELQSQLHSMEENRKAVQAQLRLLGVGQADASAPRPSAGAPPAPAPASARPAPSDQSLARQATDPRST